MCNPLEKRVMFSFSATAPQLDSLAQRVNEVARQNSNANGHFIEDLQNAPAVPFATGNPDSFLCRHCPVVQPGGSTESSDKGMGTEECGFESRNHCWFLFLRAPQFLRPAPTAGFKMIECGFLPKAATPVSPGSPFHLPSLRLALL
jgi:hypothetical protein